MTDQEQQPDTQPKESKSYAEARAEFIESAPDEVVAKFVDSEAEFGKSWSRITKENEISDPADQQQFFEMVTAAAKEKGVNVMDRVEIGSVLERSLDRFHQWKAKARSRAILDSSDADFKKFTDQEDKARHDRERTRIRDRIIAVEEQTALQHKEAKKTDGRSIWDLSDAEAKAMFARDDAVRRASSIERERLRMDTLNLQIKEERARRQK